ncbi:hypothetical protein [Helicobacter brantae]|uniref:Uncharacterized protein n=1 Tax=Helicobacter brantae TaxID=375927 RepID=A0A3D8J271_9HELI|nr:hypothetical protein [Helicobacter brantae]RDU70954.1 hypothetical protein CQA58_04030 [Helicobacter brantae]
MKGIMKILFALLVSGAWYVIAGEGSEPVCVVFFFLILFSLYVKPIKPKRSVVQEQYLEKMREKRRQRQEVNQELAQEKKVVYKDLRRRKDG